MARKILTLDVEPTFALRVEIPAPGGAVQIDFTARHREKDALVEFLDSDKYPNRPWEELVLGMVSGWSLQEPLTAVSLRTLDQRYHRAGIRIVQRYCEELGQAASGN